MFGISEIPRSRFLTIFSGIKSVHCSGQQVDLGVYFHREGPVSPKIRPKNRFLPEQVRQLKKIFESSTKVTPVWVFRASSISKQCWCTVYQCQAAPEQCRCSCFERQAAPKQRPRGSFEHQVVQKYAYAAVSSARWLRSSACAAFLHAKWLRSNACAAFLHAK